MQTYFIQTKTKAIIEIRASSLKEAISKINTKQESTNGTKTSND
jgi:hypothetical protein